MLLEAKGMKGNAMSCGLEVLAGTALEDFLRQKLEEEYNIEIPGNIRVRLSCYGMYPEVKRFCQESCSTKKELQENMKR